MNTQRILPCFSRIVSLTEEGFRLRSGRRLGTATCAKLIGAQNSLFARQNTLKTQGNIRTPRVAAFRHLCSGRDLTVLDHWEFKQVASDPEMVIIDVREPQELKDEGRIFGAKNVPLGELDALLAGGERAVEKRFHTHAGPQAQGGNIVFFCKAGVRAAKAVEIARKHGFCRARYYRGSFDHWKAQGERIIKD